MTANISDIKIYFWIRAFPFFIVFIWIAAVFSPLLEFISSGFSLISVFFLQTFSSVCHQDNYKSSLFGKQIFVCARCAGIYSGSFICAIVLLFGSKIKRYELKFLSTAVLPIIADVFLVEMGLYNYSHSFAFISGFLFGLVVYLFFISVVQDFVIKRIQK